METNSGSSQHHIPAAMMEGDLHYPSSLTLVTLPWLTTAPDLSHTPLCEYLSQYIVYSTSSAYYPCNRVLPDSYKSSCFPTSYRPHCPNDCTMDQIILACWTGRRRNRIVAYKSLAICFKSLIVGNLSILDCLIA